MLGSIVLFLLGTHIIPIKLAPESKAHFAASIVCSPQILTIDLSGTLDTTVLNLSLLLANSLIRYLSFYAANQ